MVRGFIEDEFGQKYLPGKANVYSSKEGAQEAHEAIRPSDVNLKPTQLSGMERDAERLYDLIWRQFVACQMTPYRIPLDQRERHRRRFRTARQGPHPQVRRLYPGTAAAEQAGRGRRPAGNEGRREPQADQARSEPALHQAAGALLRSEPGQGTGEARYRPPLDLRGDHLHHPGARLRNHPQPPLLCGEDGRHRHRSAQRELRQPDGLRFHRRDGGASRRRGPGRARLEAPARRVLRRFQEEARGGRSQREGDARQPADPD